MDNIDTIDWEEVISFYAKRGDIETLNKVRELMKQITDEFINQIEDPDYETEESVSSEEELDYHDEIISVKMDGDFLYCE